MALHTIFYWLASQSTTAATATTASNTTALSAIAAASASALPTHPTLSSITGSLSIICWFIVFTPQIWLNYKRQSGESLSLPFLFIWLAGDFFNLAGATMDNLLLTMRILAWYYTLADILLIIQVYYYRRKSRLAAEALAAMDKDGLYNDEDDTSSASDSTRIAADEETTLLGKDTRGHHQKTNYSTASTSSLSSVTTTTSPAHISWSSTDQEPARSHEHYDSSATLVGTTHSTGRRMSTRSERARELFQRRRVRQFLMVLLPALAIAFFVWSFLEWRQCTKCGHGRGKLPGSPTATPDIFLYQGGGHGKHHGDNDSEGKDWLPVFLGWGGAALYLGSRIPQLYKNWRLQSCEGLSIMMFMFSVFGNTLYVASILLNSLDRDYLIRNMPWWLGSAGTLVFDFMIFAQFFLYQGNEPLTELHKDTEGVHGPA